MRIVNSKGEAKRYGKRYDGYNPCDHDITEYADRLLELIKQENKEFKLGIEIKPLEDDKLLGENPEVLLLKVDILKFFDQLIQNGRINITLEDVATKFNISSNILEISKGFESDSGEIDA